MMTKIPNQSATTHKIRAAIQTSKEPTLTLG